VASAINNSSSGGGEFSSRRGTPSGSENSKTMKTRAGVLSDYDSILGGGPSAQHSHVAIHVEPPDIDAFDETDEAALALGGSIASERPIPREEMQRKTQEELGR
jgi:hypothetical protein